MVIQPSSRAAIQPSRPRSSRDAELLAELHRLRPDLSTRTTPSASPALHPQNHVPSPYQRNQPSAHPTQSSMPRPGFDKIDANGDGVIDRAEYARTNSRVATPANDPSAEWLVREMRDVDQILQPGTSSASPEAAARSPGITSGGSQCVLVFTGPLGADLQPVACDIADVLGVSVARLGQLHESTSSRGKPELNFIIRTGGSLEPSPEELACTLVAQVADLNSLLYQRPHTSRVSRPDSLGPLAAAVARSRSPSVPVGSPGPRTPVSTFKSSRPVRSVYAAPQHYNSAVLRKALGQWRRVSVAVAAVPSPVQVQAATALLRAGIRASFGQWRVLAAVIKAHTESADGAVYFKQNTDLMRAWGELKILASGGKVAAGTVAAAEAHYDDVTLRRAISGWHIVSVEMVAQSFLNRRAVGGYQKLLLLQGLIRWVNWLCASVSGVRACGVAEAYWHTKEHWRVFQTLGARLQQATIDGDSMLVSVSRLIEHQLSSGFSGWRNTNLVAREAAAMAQWSVVWRSYKQLARGMSDWRLEVERVEAVRRAALSSKQFWIDGELSLWFQVWRMTVHKLNEVLNRRAASVAFWQCNMLAVGWESWQYQFAVNSELELAKDVGDVRYAHVVTSAALHTWRWGSSSNMLNMRAIRMWYRFAKARTIRTLRQFALVSSKTGALMHQVIQRILGGRLGVAFNELRAAARQKAQGESGALDAVKRWMAGGRAAGFTTWRLASELAVEQEELVNCALFSLQDSLLSKRDRYFNSWRLGAIKDEKGADVLVQAALAYRKILSQSAFNTWYEAATAVTRKKDLAKRARAMFLNPKVGAALRTWQETAAAMVNERRMLVSAANKFLGGAKTTAMVQWREVASQGLVANRLWLKVSSIYQKEFAMIVIQETLTSAARWHRARGAGVLGFWSLSEQRKRLFEWQKMATAAQAKNQLMRKAAMAVRRSGESRCLVSWRSAAAVKRAELKVAQWAALSWRSAGLNAAWNTWFTNAIDGNHQKQLLQAAANKMIRSSLVAVIATWRCSSTDTALESNAVHSSLLWWFSHQLLQAVVLWQEVANNTRMREATELMANHHWNTRSHRMILMHWRLLNWKGKKGQDKPLGSAARGPPRRKRGTDARPFAGSKNPGGVSQLSISLDGPVGRKIRSGFFASRTHMNFPNNHNLSSAPEDLELQPSPQWPASAALTSPSVCKMLEDEALSGKAHETTADRPRTASDRIFDMADTNGDGVISREEFVRLYRSQVVPSAASDAEITGQDQSVVDSLASRIHQESEHASPLVPTALNDDFDDNTISEEQLDPARLAKVRALFDSYCAPSEHELGLSDWKLMVQEQKIPQIRDTSAAFLRVSPAPSGRPSIDLAVFLDLLADVATGLRPGAPHGQALRELVDEYLQGVKHSSRLLPAAAPQADSVDHAEVAKFCTLHDFPDKAVTLLQLFAELSLTSGTIGLSAFESFVAKSGLLGSQLSSKQAGVIFHAAAQSKGPDAELTMQQFLKTFAMLAARMMPDATSYMAGTKELFTQFIFPSLQC